MFTNFWEKNLIHDMCMDVAVSMGKTDSPPHVHEALWLMRQTETLFRPNDSAVEAQMANDQIPTDYFKEPN